MRPEARTRPPRVAIGGFFLECNRWSPSTGAAGFADGIDLAGEALAQELRRRPARLLGEATGFVDEMDRRGDWTPVPLRLAAALKVADGTTTLEEVLASTPLIA